MSETSIVSLLKSNIFFLISSSRCVYFLLANKQLSNPLKFRTCCKLVLFPLTIGNFDVVKVKGKETSLPLSYTLSHSIRSQITESTPTNLSLIASRYDMPALNHSCPRCQSALNPRGGWNRIKFYLPFKI